MLLFRHKYLVIKVFIILFVNYKIHPDTLFFNNSEYQLSFSDDFNNDELDESKWSRCKEQKRQDLNGWWKDECVYVENGCLVIKCKVQDGVLYSGGITTKNKFSQNQGLFEIKSKFTKSSALWYAFWLNTLGMFRHHQKLKNAEEGVEIDMFEILPAKNLLNMAIHYGGYEYFNNRLYTTSKNLILDDDFFDVFHIIKFCWDSDKYVLWVDEKEMLSVSVKSCGGICREDAYVILSSEFGTWGGAVDFDMLPAYMYVDYIKIYEKL